MRSTCRKLKSQVPAVEVEESCASCASYNSRLRWPSKLTREFSLLAEMWLFVFPLHSYYIYTPITHRNGKEPIERKTLREVSTTHTPIELMLWFFFFFFFFLVVGWILWVVVAEFYEFLWLWVQRLVVVGLILWVWSPQLIWFCKSINKNMHTTHPNCALSHNFGWIMGVKVEIFGVDRIFGTNFLDE